MRVEYSNRALADIRKIAAGSRRVFGERVAEALEARIRAIIEQIREAPLSAPAGSAAACNTFRADEAISLQDLLRVLEDGIRIVHIRHTSRRPWAG